MLDCSPLLCAPCIRRISSFFFFFNATATTEIYTLSLHDALPIYAQHRYQRQPDRHRRLRPHRAVRRSEEHTSELQSQFHLVCRLLLEKKKQHTVEICVHLQHYPARKVFSATNRGDHIVQQRSRGS